MVRARTIHRFHVTFEDWPLPYAISVGTIRGGEWASTVPGAVEMTVCALAIKHGIVPPTINLDDPDPACPLHKVSLTDALAKGTPVAYLIGTPAFFLALLLRMRKGLA